MQRIVSTILITLWIMAGPASAGQDIQTVLQGIRHKYGGLPGLTLSYEREVISKTMAMLGDQIKGDMATGKMFFKPPFYLKLDQATPTREIIMTDEKDLWWYIPDQKRVYRYPAGEFGREMEILSNIFQGLMDVEEKFKAALKAPSAEKRHEIELRPVAPWQNIDHLDISVTDEYEIETITIHYQLGSITIFTLRHIEATPGFTGEDFKFTIPEGVVLIEEKGVDILRPDEGNNRPKDLE